MHQTLSQQVFGHTFSLKPINPSQSPLPLTESLATPSTVWDRSTAPYEVDRKQKNNPYQNFQQKSDKTNKYKTNQNTQNFHPKTSNTTSTQNFNRSFKTLANILKQVKLINVTKDDNFQCTCKDSDDHTINHNCIACQGNGSVDGSHNIVKFISFIMQFKLGTRGPYKTTESKQNSINKPSQQYQLQNIPLSDKNTNKNQKQITLLNKNTKQSNKNNQFHSSITNNQQPNQQIYNQSNIKSNNNKSLQQVQTNNQNSLNIHLTFDPIRQSLPNSQSEYLSTQSSQRYKSNTDQIKTQELNSKQTTLTTLQKNNQSNDDYSTQNKTKKVRFKCAQSKEDNTANQMQHEVPNTRSMVYEIGGKKTIDVRKSLPSQKPFMHLHQLTAKLSKQSKIHNQYFCDQCKVSPIEGSRFHCTSLMCKNNYDLCEKCYKRIGHRHQMKQIKYTQVNQLCQSLQRFSTNTNSSLKFPKGIRSSNVNCNINYNEKNLIQQQGNENQPQKTIFKSSIH